MKLNLEYYTNNQNIFAIIPKDNSRKFGYLFEEKEFITKLESKINIKNNLKQIEEYEIIFSKELNEKINKKLNLLSYGIDFQNRKKLQKIINKEFIKLKEYRGEKN